MNPIVPAISAPAWSATVQENHSYYELRKSGFISDPIAACGFQVFYGKVLMHLSHFPIETRIAHNDSSASVGGHMNTISTNKSPCLYSKRASPVSVRQRERAIYHYQVCICIPEINSDKRNTKESESS